MIVIVHAQDVFGAIEVMNASQLGQGVSFFFVLSGFILAYNYPFFENKQQVRQFFVARFARIWPLHVATCFLWISLIFSFDQKVYFPGVEGFLRLISNIFLVQAWIPLHDWALSFNGVAWSISTEFFFYLAFPVLIFLWGRYWRRLVVMQVCVIISILFVAQRINLPKADTYPGVGLLGVVYFNPLVRILEFMIGMAVAQIIRRHSDLTSNWKSYQWLLAEVASILAVVLAVLATADLSGMRSTFGEVTAYYISHEGLWLFWAALIGVFALSNGPLHTLISSRFFVFLGETSFALYLMHALAVRYLAPYSEQLKGAGMIAYMLFWLFCLAFSALLFLGLEQPFRRMILNWTRSGSEVSKKGSMDAYGLVSSASLVLLILISLGLFLFRPPAISVMDSNLMQKFLSSSGLVKVDGEPTFINGIAVLAVRVKEEATDTLRVEVLLHTRKSARVDSILALHLNDAQGKIVQVPGDVRLDRSSLQLPAGTTWVQPFSVQKNIYEQSSSLGIAMYDDPAALFAIIGGERDWGGRRLIIKK